MRHYKGWTPEFRQANLKLVNRAKEMGWVKPPKKCRRCGQREGILHLHCEDYDVSHKILSTAFRRFPARLFAQDFEKLDEVLEPICWTCHMMHHSEYRAKYAVRKYFESVARGFQAQPVYRSDFAIINKIISDFNKK